MIRAVHKTGSWVPLLHATCKQIVTSEAVGVLSAHKEFGGQRWVKCITVKWITELGRQLRDLGRNVHVVGWLGLGGGGWGGGVSMCVCVGGGGGGGALAVFVCLFVFARHWFHAIHSQSPS